MPPRPWVFLGFALMAVMAAAEGVCEDQSCEDPSSLLQIQAAEVSESGPAPETLYVAVACGEQAENLGVFDTAEACAAEVAEKSQDWPFSSDFMWSSSYTSWGCRICKHGESAGGHQNPHWNVYTIGTRKEKQSCGKAVRPGATHVGDCAEGLVCSGRDSNGWRIFGGKLCIKEDDVTFGVKLPGLLQGGAQEVPAKSLKDHKPSQEVLDACGEFETGTDYPFNDVATVMYLYNPEQCSNYCFEEDAPHFAFATFGEKDTMCWCKRKLENGHAQAERTSGKACKLFQKLDEPCGKQPYPPFTDLGICDLLYVCKPPPVSGPWKQTGAQNTCQWPA